MPGTPEDIVEYAYDNITEWYLQWVESQKSPRQRYTKLLLDKLQPYPSILELGCGPGVPIVKMLLEQGAQVVANDISTKQIEMARARCPGAKLVAGDMTTLTFEPASFDGVVSFYTLFHLPRTKLKAMLIKIHDWLKPGGIFVLNLATIDEEEIHGEFLGYGMFWSSYGVDESREILSEIGFDVLQAEVLHAGDGKLEEGDPDFDAEFMWVMISESIEMDTNDAGQGRARSTDAFRQPSPSWRPERNTSRDGSNARGRRDARRRSWAVSRQSGSGLPSLTRRSSLADRLNGKFTVAGPDETPQMRLAHEPFVQPGYADLNPSYEQASNAKPVWSLAKPLPRVVRSGMVPTKEELLQARAKAQNSRRLGLEVDPTDLERGQINPSLNPRKIVAQVEDARVQRESNLARKILSSDASSMGFSDSLKRASTWGAPLGQLPRVEEGEALTDSDAPHDEQPSDDSEPDEVDPLLGDAGDPLELPPIDEKACPDDLDPLVQDLVEHEVHNHHTTWSVIRTAHREALAESLAVFVQLTVGFCADLAVTIANAGNPNTTAWAWGLATMMAIYISGGVSGAHLNPAVTVMLWFYRGFPNRKLPGYFLAQFGGAFFAALVAYGVYYHSIEYHRTTSLADTGIIDSFVTSQRAPWVTPAAAFVNEFVGTAILAITILALGDDQNAPPGAGMNALIVGLVITCLGLTFAYQTGGALNPSRDFGPRLALLVLGYGSDLFRNPYWLYGPWAAAISGAFTGAFLYDFMIFTGGESPVNYPVQRTKRAMKKSRRKWERALRLAQDKGF
ncbi:aquaporin-like protein [Aspergillus floccosus]